MVSKHNMKRIDEYLWEIPQTFREDMRVPARIYADDELLEEALKEKSVEQLDQHGHAAGDRRVRAGDARHSPGLWLSHRRRGGHTLAARHHLAWRSRI